MQVVSFWFEFRCTPSSVARLSREIAYHSLALHQLGQAPIIAEHHVTNKVNT